MECPDLTLWDIIEHRETERKGRKEKQECYQTCYALLIVLVTSKASVMPEPLAKSSSCVADSGKANLDEERDLNYRG